MAEYCDIVEENWSIGDNLQMHVRATLAESLTIGGAVPRSGMRTPTREAWTIGDVLGGHYRSRISETLTIGDVVSSITNGRNALVEHLRIRDHIPMHVKDVVAEAWTIGDASHDGALLDRVSESLAIADALPGTLTLRNVIVERGALGDRLVARARDKVAEAWTIGDAIPGYIHGRDRITEALTISAALGGGSVIHGLLRDGVHIHDAVSSVAHGKNVASDRMQIGDALVEPRSGDAWAAPLDILAMSRYTNFPFNSMGVIGGKLIGVTDDGAYLLEGDDDAGERIVGRMRGDLNDLIDGQRGPVSSPNMRRPHHAWLGYRATGALKFILSETGSGDEIDHEHELPASAALQFTSGRVPLAHGATFRYSRITIENVAGCDFALNDSKVHFRMLQRRV